MLRELAEIYQGEAAEMVVYEGTKIFGRALDSVVVLAKGLAYNEACDSSPSSGDIREFDEVIRAFIKARDEYADWLAEGKK